MCAYSSFFGERGDGRPLTLQSGESATASINGLRSEPYTWLLRIDSSAVGVCG